MEFADVVRRRRMVRRYAPTPVDPAVVERAIRHATHAPSAGFSQGWGFLVLDRPDDVERYWRATSDDVDAPGRWLAGLMTAPVVILPCSSRAAYVERYAEPDKGWTDRAEERWAKPYWDLDTAMASLLILLTAVDEGLGACFFGVPPARVEAVRAAFGIPDDHEPIGAITLGHRLPDDVPGATGSAGSPARRRRRPLEEVLHRGRWGGDAR
ncbi:nitroreductase family protein [Nocardioides sp. TRM66260-LWL]|uniref:nitroreductase family protein n=1 Tax=Nocardioides sp. TRM66260-LWL TaxID=2874478 RepID=UPI001CC58702|nr:nitroreductase family protein [Nocardioides sp. TRM66260-LWL]MBZ5735726.1 nitroreductase family protein [Nocardioides sp. TRM66260-LWL]